MCEVRGHINMYFTGYKAGCVSEERYQRYEVIRQGLEEGIGLLEEVKKSPGQWMKLMGREPNDRTKLKRYSI